MRKVPKTNQLPKWVSFCGFIVATILLGPEITTSLIGAALKYDAVRDKVESQLETIP